MVFRTRSEFIIWPWRLLGGLPMTFKDFQVLPSTSKDARAFPNPRPPHMYNKDKTWNKHDEHQNCGALRHSPKEDATHLERNLCFCRNWISVSFLMVLTCFGILLFSVICPGLNRFSAQKRHSSFGLGVCWGGFQGLPRSSKNLQALPESP